MADKLFRFPVLVVHPQEYERLQRERQAQRLVDSTRVQQAMDLLEYDPGRPDGLSALITMDGRIFVLNTDKNRDRYWKNPSPVLPEIRASV